MTIRLAGAIAGVSSVNNCKDEQHINKRHEDVKDGEAMEKGSCVPPVR